MNKESNLKFALSKCQRQINELKKNIDNSEIVNTLYNKLLIEKAIIKNKLYKEQPKNFFINFIKNLKNKKSKTISDYFKNK